MDITASFPPKQVQGHASSQDLYDDAASKFAQEVWGLITKEKLLQGSPQVEKIVHFLQPDQLNEKLKLAIGSNAANEEDLLDTCKRLIKYSVKTGHPMFFNQLYGGVDPYGMVAAWLTEALNTNEYTYEVAPAFTSISNAVLAKLNSLVGFHDGDGIFCAGGSMGNMMALALARFRHNPDLNKMGLFESKRLVVFVSEDSHYSHLKGVTFLSFGKESLIEVKTDERGRMSVEDLQTKINNELNKGHIPIAVVATSGTTVLGAFDDLNSLADVCKLHRLYFHVDACWGGGVLFSPPRRKLLLDGISRADSVVISMHKMTGVPLQCVPLLVKEKGALEKCFSCRATYIFQPDKCYDPSCDLGLRTIMCGRKADAMKLWLVWKARGDAGMEEHIDTLFQRAQQFKQLIQHREGFRLVQPEFECTNICFWFLPPSMRDQEEDKEWWDKLHMVAPKLKKKMCQAGCMLIGYQPLPSHGWVNFFRIIFVNPRVTNEHIEDVVSKFEELGHDL